MSAIPNVSATPALRLVEQDPFDRIKRSIVEGHDRLTKGHAEWVEGSLQIALALRDGRDQMPANVGFGEWLKVNNLNFFNRNDRMALLNLAADPELAREILNATKSRSYEVIWNESKSRFQKNLKTTKKRTRRVTQLGKSVRRYHRVRKLGEETLKALEGTSLGSSEEISELVVLNRGAAPGEHTEVVAKLVADATAGKAVSAIATGARLSGRASPSSRKLIDAFNRRMTFMWDQADRNARDDLLDYLSGDEDVDAKLDRIIARLGTEPLLRALRRATP